MSDNPVCKSCAHLRVNGAKPYCSISVRDEWGSFVKSECVFDSNQKELKSLFQPAIKDESLYHVRVEGVDLRRIRKKLEDENKKMREAIQARFWQE